MIALNITDLKDFTNKLFIGNVFDSFWLTEAVITTFGTFSIDGHLQMDFFETDEKNILSENKRTYSLWKEIRPFCYSIIRGKRTPLHFKIILQLSHNRIPSLLKASGSDIPSENVHGLFLNFQYKNKSLLCTTGVSLGSFSLDKRLEQYWDSQIKEFFRQNQIIFEEI